MSLRPSSDLHPTAGARVLLERSAVDPDGARAHYAGAILTPTERFEFTAILARDGEVALAPAAEPGAPPAPAELEKLLYTIAKLTARGAAGRSADGLPPWPPRILRWRGPGRGGGQE